jgi:hypothetical protein
MAPSFDTLSEQDLHEEEEEEIDFSGECDGFGWTFLALLPLMANAALCPTSRSQGAV